MSDLLTRELAPVDDELQAEVTRARARAARTRRELADVAKALVEAAEGVVEPREDLGISALGRRAERVTLELVDVQTAVEGVRDRLDELADDLERVLVLHTGHVGRVAADVGEDECSLRGGHARIIACASAPSRCGTLLRPRHQKHRGALGTANVLVRDVERLFDIDGGSQVRDPNDLRRFGGRDHDKAVLDQARDLHGVITLAVLELGRDDQHTAVADCRRLRETEIRRGAQSLREVRVVRLADAGDHDVVLLVDRLGRRSDLDVEPRLQHELELAVAVGDAEETVLARRALHVRESIGARAWRSDGPLENAEKTQDDQDEREDDERVDPGATPRRCGRAHRWSRRVPPASAEVPEEPHDHQDHDDELDEPHLYLRTVAYRMSDRFSAWVSTADAVRPTPKKLDKLALLGAYLGRLEDADLVIASRLFAGAPFPRKDERVLSVGWSALAGVLLERSGKSDADMSASYQRHADLGDVAFELVGDSPPEGEPLGLVDVETSFTEMAAVRGTSAKRDVLRSVMRRASAGEARYITKVIAGETRIGLREGLLEDAIAKAFARDRAAVARANMLTGDIGDAARRAQP